MEMAELQQAVSHYGYLALFVGTFFEGETVFLVGGMLAQQGLLNPWFVALTAMAGGMAGDQFFFLLGYWRGADVLARFRNLARRAVKVRRLVRRAAVPLMLLSRFLYGFRLVVPLACGMARIAPWRFLLLNSVSACLWCLCFGGLGYLASSMVLTQGELLRSLPWLALAMGVILGAGYLLSRWLMRRVLSSEGPGQD